MLFKIRKPFEYAKISVKYLPSGDIFRNKLVYISNLFKFFLGVSWEQKYYLEYLNKIHNAMYPCLMDNEILLEQWEKDLGIPDDTFYKNGTIQDRMIDVMVKYCLMNCNTLECFREVAGAYGCIIYDCNTLELMLPAPLCNGVSTDLSELRLNISCTSEACILPLMLPACLKQESVRRKLYKIFIQMLDATSKLTIS